MEDVEVRRNVWDLLGNMDSLEPLKQLFWTELNYERINTRLSRYGWPEHANNALAEDPILFAGYEDFHIIYNRLNTDKLLLGLERLVVNHLIKDHDRALFIFSDDEQRHWHFVNLRYYTPTEGRGKKRPILRRITIGPDERLRTAVERISMLDTSSISPFNALYIQQRHDEAFDVEAVTKEFLKKYVKVFEKIQKQLSSQTKDEEWAHDYSLQFLNRLMFLYFIQRKRCIGEDPDFILNFWKAYNDSGQPDDTFFSNWLEVMFFEAFNRKFQAGRSDRQHIPGDIRRALSVAPYLNGGLFSRNALDNKYSFKVPDTVFKTLFDEFDGRSPGFMEAHNFTIREDSPFDQEVAVDPEMIGKVYESLVNVTFENREEDLRGTAGIFYTPRVEIDMMCRLSLVDWLTNHLGKEHKHLIYEVVFAYDPEEQQEADADVAKAGLWERLDGLLKEVTVLDPACGPGSFLVGMLTVLDDLQKRAEKRLGIQETSSYERRKRIIGQNLYGVDVMSWAVHVAELRLWLQLAVETELDLAKRGVEPLLPNLSFKIRPGDSLVQEVGGINFALHQYHTDVPGNLKHRLTRLKKEKLKFFRGDPDTAFRFESDIKKEERSLFQDILFARKRNQQKQINVLTAKTESLPEQLTLQSIQKEEPVQLDLQTEEWKRQRIEIQKELEQTESAYNALREAAEPPFIWDLAFVEIFEGDKGGFDIVVGNPPYVRQEKIAPPCLREDDYSTSEWRRLKKEYKDKLQLSVAAAYPGFYQYNPSDGRFKKIDGKSDLYVYFYLHGLSLLNPKGSFCFITSNSWLDVGYGKDLQEFLLKNCRVKMIIYNQAKRSFAQADVNTIIALISAPDGENLDNVVRFVMFRVPFEDILSSIIFDDIEGAQGRRNMVGKEGRIHPISQRDLLNEGIEPPDAETKRTPSLKVGGVYTGNKWGGKYLRAPDIFFKILEKGKGKLVKLGDIADVRSGVKTGANEFFYLDQDKIDEWSIEEEFLKPVIKSPRECRSILIDPEGLKYKILMCHEEREDLRGTNVLDYIEWGEEKGFHNNASVRSRRNWWECPDERGNVFWAKEIHERIAAYVSNDNMYADCRLYVACVKTTLKAILNSTIIAFFAETMNRDIGSGGRPRSMMVYEVQRMFVVSPDTFDSQSSSKMVDFFAEMRNRSLLTMFEELGLLTPNRDYSNIQPEDVQLDKILPDRRGIDRIVFESLGLNEKEQLEIYKAVVGIIKDRLAKARSGGGKYLRAPDIFFKILEKGEGKLVKLGDIEGAQGRRNMVGKEGRIHPISQRDLLAEGILTSQEDRGKSLSLRTGSYIGGKWGGKYLRAPDIFFRILEIGKDDLVVLGEVARVISVSWSRQGNNSRLMFRKTDALPSGQVTDVLKSPRDASRINLRCHDTHYLLRLTPQVRRQLIYAPILLVDLRGNKHLCHRSLDDIAFTHNFHGIYPLDEELVDDLTAILNSTLTWLFIEVFGRRGLGGGAIRILVDDLRFQFPILNPVALNRQDVMNAFEKMADREIKSVFEELGFDLCHQTRCENTEHPYEFIEPEDVSFDKIFPDRLDLDKAVFGAINLNESEQLEVYRALVSLVKSRLLKVKSV